MNLRIDPDASLLSASHGPRRSSTAEAGATVPASGQHTRPADRDEAVLTSSRADSVHQAATLDSASAAATAGRLGQSEILAASEAAVQAQANTLPESVLRLLQ